MVFAVIILNAELLLFTNHARELMVTARLFAVKMTENTAVGNAVGNVILVAVELAFAWPHCSNSPFGRKLYPFAAIDAVPTVRPWLEPAPANVILPGVVCVFAVELTVP